MIWSTVKGVFMLQSSEIFVASGLLFPLSYILLASLTFLTYALKQHSNEPLIFFCETTAATLIYQMKRL